jgi:hypothetical protein
MFLDEVAYPVDIICIVAIEDLCMFDGFFVEIDNIVTKVGVLDDPKFTASIQPF